MQLRKRNLGEKRKRSELEESKNSENSESSEKNYELSVVSHFTL